MAYTQVRNPFSQNTGLYDEGLPGWETTGSTQKSAVSGAVGGAVGAGLTAGLTTMNPWVAIGTTLLSFGLSALTAPKQRREWTGQDALLYTLKKQYTEIRERKEAAISIASAISGKPREAYMGLAGFAAIREPLEGGGTAIGRAEQRIENREKPRSLQTEGIYSGAKRKQSTISKEQRFNTKEEKYNILEQKE